MARLSNRQTLQSVLRVMKLPLLESFATALTLAGTSLFSTRYGLVGHAWFLDVELEPLICS